MDAPPPSRSIRSHAAASLRRFQANPTAWEVYVAGLELGNACTELAEPQEQTRRFIECTRLRAREHRDIYKLDQPFLDAIRLGFPQTAGVAIGLDRLFMLLGNLDDIARTNAFL